jgi:hypothetical protein
MDELSRLAPEILIVALLCATVVGSVVAVQWRRVRTQEADIEFAQHLIDKGVSVAEIEKLTALRTPPAKGMLEQFGNLGPGTKFGLIFLAFMVIGTTMGMVSQYIFWVARK